jgi:hypothetical protein
VDVNIHYPSLNSPWNEVNWLGMNAIVYADMERPGWVERDPWTHYPQIMTTPSRSEILGRNSIDPTSELNQGMWPVRILCIRKDSYTVYYISMKHDMSMKQTALAHSFLQQIP